MAFPVLREKYVIFLSLSPFQIGNVERLHALLYRVILTLKYLEYFRERMLHSRGQH